MRKNRLQKLLLTLFAVFFILIQFASGSVNLASTTSSTNLTIHFKNISGWAQPNIYYYSSNQNAPGWPGTKMNSDGNGWYSYTIHGWQSANILFNDGKKQIPSAGQPGFSISQESWVKDGKIYTSNPEQTSTPTSINISSPSNINVGDSTSVKAVVTYSDASQKNDSVSWKISNSNLASIDNSTGNQINLKALSAGTVTLTATEGTVNVSKTINITNNDSNNKIIVHFYTSWQSPKIYYWNVTPSVSSITWPGVAMTNEGNNWYNYQFNGASSANLIFNGNGQQTADLSRTSGEWWYKNNTWYSANPDKDIPAPTPTAINISSINSINVGDSTPIKAVVNYSDGSQKNDSVSWKISDSNLASIDSSTGNQVNLKALSTGTITITATEGSITTSKTLNIINNDTNNKIKVHFYTLWQSPKIYYWNVSPSIASISWPGVAMTSEGNNWYNYQLDGASSANIIFNGNSQQTADLSRTSGEWWYKDNTWYSTDPDVDTTAPTITTTPAPGNQEPTSLDIVLNVKDNKDTNPKAYYTTDGTDPIIGGTLYSGKITINKDTTIKAITVDSSGNVSKIYSFDFKLGQDVTSPVVTTSITPSTYKDAKTITLNVTDNKDSKPKVYYTLDGSEPSASSKLYGGEGITISKTTTISTLAIDNSGNKNFQYFRFVIGNDNTLSNDFRNDSIYFVITTRFYDGDPSNNVHCWDDTKAGNPDSDPAWRGDFEGLIEKLDYIKALGFDAVWITPVVKDASGYDYHGYHAINFSEVDPRYATKSKGETAEQSYQRLINEAHKRGMKIIQDIVLNHTSNFGEENLFPMFKRNNPTGLNDSADTALTMLTNSWLPSDYNSLSPDKQFADRINAMKNDNTDVNNIYHHEKSLSWESYTVQTGQIAGDCVDLNTENPTVANYLIKAYDKYIDMGVDSFRIDTVKHVSRLDFNNYYIPAFKKEGGDNFYIFGEVCTRYRDVWNSGIPAISAPFYTWKESKDYPWGTLADNTQSVAQNWNDNSTTANQPTSNNAFLNGNDYHTPDLSKSSGLDVIDFPMHWAFNKATDAFNTALGGDKYYNDPTWNVTYVDSHDYAPDGAPENERFAGSQDTWAENLDLMFTFRGIPCILYGSEIEFQKGKPIDVGPNAPLSTTGRAYFGDNITGSVDVSDFGKYTNATGNIANTLNYPLAQHIRRLNLLRRNIPALRTGEYSVDGVSGDVIAFKRRYTDKTTGVDSFCLVSISGNATFTGIPNGTYVDAITGDSKTVTSGNITVNCSGKGNMRVYVLNLPGNPAPGKVGDTGTYLK